MARLLKPLQESIDNRFALYRRMCARLGVSRHDEVPQEFQSDVRDAVLACGVCRRTVACAEWLDACKNGVPDFCRARSSFQRLVVVQRALDGSIERVVKRSPGSTR